MSEAPLIFPGGPAVSSREVEQVLLSHPAVAEAAVLGIPGPFGNEIIAAAVRLSTPLPAGAADLAAFCRTRLTSYRVPVRWLLAGPLPRTLAGTVCRATLAAQFQVFPWPRAADIDLRVPPQARRSWEDTDY